MTVQTLTPEQQAKHFAVELRRILVLQKLMLYCVDGMRNGRYLPKDFTQRMTGFANSIHMLQSFIRSKTTKETWDEITGDLNHDRLHDVSCLIDEVIDINNVEDILNVIKDAKYAQL